MAGLRVIEIFDSLQGEGYWTGTPMTFVRLAGCNAPELGLACLEWCDTLGSWGQEAGAELSPFDIVEHMVLPRLCLTGGEPLLQLEAVVALVAEAHRRGLEVHLETNGTLDPPLTDGETIFDWAVVSPKPPGYSISTGWDGVVDEVKLVVDEGFETVVAEKLAAQHPEAIVSIQPIWAQNAEARAIRLVMDHPTWRFSLQTHKYLGIR